MATDIYNNQRAQLRKSIIGLRERWTEIDGRLRNPSTADAERDKLCDERKQIRRVVDELQEELRGFPPDPNTSRE